MESKDEKTDLKNTKKETKRNSIQLEVDDLANKLSAEEAINDELQKQIDLKESLGDKGSDSDYSSINKSLVNQIDIIKKQNAKIKEQQKTVKNGSEEWYKYQESIDSNNNSIKDLTQSMIDNATQGIKSVNDALDEGISKLDDSDELLRAKADNATNANEKNSFLDGVIGNVYARKSVYDNTLNDISGYKQNAINTINGTKIDNADIYAKIQSCISSNTEIPSDIIVSLNNPTLAVACAQYNEALASYDTINAAKKLYDETSKTDIQSQISAQRDNIESSANEQLESISADETKLQADINKSEAAGLSQSKAQYTERIRLSKEREKALQNEHSQLENWLSDMMASGEIIEGDEQYEKTQNDLKNIEADLINCTADEIKFNSAIKEMDLSRLEKLVSLLDVVKNRLSGLVSLAESHGHNASDDLLLKQIEFSFTETKTYKDMIEESLKSLRNPENLSQWGISEDLMEDLITLVQNGKVNEAEQILKDKGIDIENLTAIHEKFDKIASSTSSCYSAMVEGEKYYDSLIQNRIDMINEYLDKLQKEKDLKDRTLALEKARFALEQAKNNLTKKIWNGEEWVYSADTDAIQSAQEAYDDAEYEELTNSLNDLVDVLERLMKDHNLYDDNGNLTENGEEVKRVLSDIDAKELPNVLKALIERGFSEEELTSIAKSNGVDISSQMHSDVLQSLMDNIRANLDMTKWLYDYENFPAPQINIPNVYDTANLDSLAPSNKTIGNNFHFDKVEFILPNVNDNSKANDLINEVYGQLSNLNLYAKQYNWDD